VIFVDTNVFMYITGGEHPLKQEATEWFRSARRDRELLATSAEVGQELLHAYLPAGRLRDLSDSLALWSSVDRIWAIEGPDIERAHRLVVDHPRLSARDLLHLACCRRHKATGIKTFDRALAEAFSG